MLNNHTGDGKMQQQEQDTVLFSQTIYPKLDDDTLPPLLQPPIRERRITRMSEQESIEVCIRREKALKDSRAYLNSAAVGTNGQLPLNTFKDVASSQIFLQLLFKLFDEDGDGLIDQDEFLQHFHQRLTDDKGRQFAEVVETATFAIAQDQYIDPPCLARIFATKGVLDKFFRLMDKESSGMVQVNVAMDLIAKLTVSQMQTSLTKENLDYLQQLFQENCGENKEINLESFTKIIQSKNSFFTERVFRIFDRDGSGSISLQEFLDAVNKFSSKDMDGRIKFLFEIYDIDGDGLIQQEELRAVMNACMEENGMKFAENQIDDLTAALFEDADSLVMGAITLEALKSQLNKHDGLLQNLSYSIERWLVPPKPVQKTSYQKIMDMKPHQLSINYMRNNVVFVSYLFVFFAVNIGLFVSRAYEYAIQDSNGFVILARACGQCLNFTCMFVVVLVLRKSITFLRALGFSRVLPLDDHIYLHKLTGWFIFCYSVLHTVAHIGNLVFYADKKKQEDEDKDKGEHYYELGEFMWKALFTNLKASGLCGGAYPTGVALLVILCVMVLCSQNFVRKSGRFEVFYWTHRLYFAFFILCIFHGPNFWKWFVGPGLIFVIELLVRFIQRRTGHGKTLITEGILLPSKVTHVVIKRPPNFYFQPGDYLFVKIPAIAKYEWHPFTISSAPEQEDCLWLHIRGVGEWTNSLYAYMEKQQMKMIARRNSIAVDLRENNRKKSFKSVKSPNVKSTGPPEVRITFSPVTNNGYVNDGLTMENEDLADSGIVNFDTVSSTDETGNADDKNGSMDLLKPTESKKSLGLAKSLPLCNPNTKPGNFERKPVVRSLSVKDPLPVVLARTNSHTVCYRQRSRGQSFRHLRIKPQVVHLSFPTEPVMVEETEEELNASGDISEMDVEQGSAVLDEIIERPQDVICYDEYASNKPLEVFIDGPYGAPSSRIFQSEHAVLIGTGIGVTPFASILQSIMRRYWKAQQKCPKCDHCWTSKVPGFLNLKKVDFFWINRDQKSFEWFVNLLSQLEIEQAEQGGALERFLDMHMYITSALQKTDMKAVGLHLALDLLHEKEKRDLITGLKTRTQAGRPNWNKVFKQISQQQKGKVTVFFCGPVQMARTLKLKCDEFGFAFKKEIF